MDNEEIINAAAKLKPGDKVYQTDGVRIYESTVRRVLFDADGLVFDCRAVGKSVFLTREDAEQRMCGN